MKIAHAQNVGRVLISGEKLTIFQTLFDIVPWAEICFCMFGVLSCFLAKQVAFAAMICYPPLVGKSCFQSSMVVTDRLDVNGIHDPKVLKNSWHLYKLQPLSGGRDG